LKLVRIAKRAYFILGVVWFVFGLVRITGLLSEDRILSNAEWIAAILMFANALVLVLIGRWLKEDQRWPYYFGLLVLLTNILLTITDDFGVFDLIYLALAISLFVFLIITRAHYISNSQSN
jgi:hypothetical protein